MKRRPTLWFWNGEQWIVSNYENDLLIAREGLRRYGFCTAVETAVRVDIYDGRDGFRGSYFAKFGEMN